MRIPKWIKIILVILVAMGAFGLIMAIMPVPWVLNSIGQVAIIFTLAVLIVYTYYTQSHAMAEWTPSASLHLVWDEEEPCRFRLKLHNHCKHSLRCCCNLNASINGDELRVGGFFSGESPFDLQPFGEGLCAVMNVKSLVAKHNMSFDQLRREATKETYKNQFRFDIEFSYKILDSNYRETTNPKQPYFFDFRPATGRWVLDV